MSLAPDAISGLELWLDADAITGLSDGDTVLTWPDQSGNGNDYTNNGSLATITYETAELNGLPIVTMFDGGFTGPLSLSSPFSLFYVGRFNEGTSAQRRALQGGGLPLWALGVSSSQWWYSCGPTSIASGVTANTDWVAHGVIQEVAETREEAPFSMGLQFVYDIDTNAVPTVTSRISALDPGALSLGDAGVSDVDFGGDLAEVVAYSRALKPDERVGLTDYFREKWGGIVASSSEDTDIEVQIAREATVVAHNFPAADTAARIAREGVNVAHHFPELETDARLARLGVVIAISRPHGWS